MKDKEKAFNGALGSTEMEGIDLPQEIMQIVKQALEEAKGDKSFLFELNKLLEERKQNGFRKK